MVFIYKTVSRPTNRNAILFFFVKTFLTIFQGRFQLHLHHSCGYPQTFSDLSMGSFLEPGGNQNRTLTPGKFGDDAFKPLQPQASFRVACRPRRVIRNIQYFGDFKPFQPTCLAAAYVHGNIDRRFHKIGGRTSNWFRNVVTIKPEIGFVQSLAGDVLRSQATRQPGTELVIPIDEQLPQRCPGCLAHGPAIIRNPRSVHTPPSRTVQQAIRRICCKSIN